MEGSKGADYIARRTRGKGPHSIKRRKRKRKKKKKGCGKPPGNGRSAGEIES